MDVLIVKLDGDVVHDLNIEGDSDACRTAVWLCKQPVVKTAAAAQTFPSVRKCKARNKDDVERGDVDGRAVRLRLPDVHLAAVQILQRANLPWLERLMFDLEEAGPHTLNQE